MTHEKYYVFSISPGVLSCKLAYPQGVKFRKGQKTCSQAFNFDLS